MECDAFVGGRAHSKPRRGSRAPCLGPCLGLAQAWLRPGFQDFAGGKVGDNVKSPLLGPAAQLIIARPQGAKLAPRGTPLLARRPRISLPLPRAGLFRFPTQPCFAGERVPDVHSNLEVDAL